MDIYGRYDSAGNLKTSSSGGGNDEIKRLNDNLEKNTNSIMPDNWSAWSTGSINLVKIELGYEAFHAVILGSDQGRKIYKKKIQRLIEQYRLIQDILFIDNCEKMPLAYKMKKGSLY